MGSRNASVILTSLLIALGNNAAGQSLAGQSLPGQSLPGEERAESRSENDTGSAVTAKEANALVEYHNKARGEVGVAPVKWSPELASFAQAWADEVAKTGKLLHRPREGKWKQQFGENMAWGTGEEYGVLTGAETWYSEIKSYAPGTSIPEDFSRFNAAHYTQMVWKDTTEIGAGKAVIRTGQKQGWLVIVCNYNPPGNIAGQKPY
jgi:pathogenesis-related protein 1